MEKSSIITGKVWIVKDNYGNAIESIDTDQIFHNKYLTITEKEKMKDYAFSNLDGWRDFPSKAHKGDILVVGMNFGAGSSRQQAVDCFSALGIQAIIGESFGAIYKRNAINSGFAIIECTDIIRKLNTEDEIKIDFLKGEIIILKSGERVVCKPFSKIQWEIYKSDVLLNISPK
jgi:3-isopropylmalate/(R)-2-methylmalate dehydratase small subunit